MPVVARREYGGKHARILGDLEKRKRHARRCVARGNDIFQMSFGL